MTNPATLDVKFTSISEILAIPTPVDVIKSRITPEMEKKLVFLFTLPKSNATRHLNWFLASYLSKSDNELLFIDVIRFIQLAIHPTNEQLASNFISRYSVILYFLKNMKSFVTSSSIKLSLIFDFLFFSNRENVMNLEPTILLIDRCLERQTYITSTLLEFMMSICVNYIPELADVMKRNVCDAVKFLISKGVIKGIDHIYTSNAIEEDIKDIIGELFAPILAAKATTVRSIEKPQDWNVLFTKLKNSDELEIINGIFTEFLKSYVAAVYLINLE